MEVTDFSKFDFLEPKINTWKTDIEKLLLSINPMHILIQKNFTLYIYHKKCGREGQKSPKKYTFSNFWFGVFGVLWCFVIRKWNSVNLWRFSRIFGPLYAKFIRSFGFLGCLFVILVAYVLDLVEYHLFWKGFLSLCQKIWISDRICALCFLFLAL